MNFVPEFEKLNQGLRQGGGGLGELKHHPRIGNLVNKIAKIFENLLHKKFSSPPRQISGYAL